MMEQVASGKRPPAQKKPSYLPQERVRAPLDRSAMQTRDMLVEHSQH